MLIHSGHTFVKVFLSAGDDVIVVKIIPLIIAVSIKRKRITCLCLSARRARRDKNREQRESREILHWSKNHDGGPLSAAASGDSSMLPVSGERIFASRAS